jgi:plasmid stability protein
MQEEEGIMASITISEMPEELHQRLLRDAARNDRSPNQQAITILDRALNDQQGQIELPTPITPLRPVTTEEIMSAIHEGAMHL